MRLLKNRRILRIKIRNITKIKKAWKRHLYIAEYKNTKNKLLGIQSHWRSYKTRKLFKNYKKSVIKIESIIRKYLARKRFLKLKNLAIRLQPLIRLFLHKRHTRRNNAAKKIQNFMQTMYYLKNNL